MAFLPQATTLTSAPAACLLFIKRSTWRSTLLLKPPARPRSDTTTTISTFLTSSCLRNSAFSEPPTRLATLANISTMGLGVRRSRRHAFTGKADLRSSNHFHGTRDLLRRRDGADTPFNVVKVGHLYLPYAVGAN